MSQNQADTFLFRQRSRRRTQPSALHQLYVDRVLRSLPRLCSRFRHLETLRQRRQRRRLGLRTERNSVAFRGRRCFPVLDRCSPIVHRRCPILFNCRCFPIINCCCYVWLDLLFKCCSYGNYEKCELGRTGNNRASEHWEWDDYCVSVSDKCMPHVIPYLLD